MSEDAVAEACPFCRGYCNCKACLRCIVRIHCLFHFKLYWFLYIIYQDDERTKALFAFRWIVLLWTWYLKCFFFMFFMVYCRTRRSSNLILAMKKKISTRSICYKQFSHIWNNLMKNKWRRRVWRLRFKVFCMLLIFAGL